jgi:hypothetical protein
VSDEAVLDAPVLDATEPVVDETPSIESEAVPEIPESPVTEEVKGDERVLPQWIRNLKTTDPAAFKEAKGIFFGKRSIDEKLKDFDVDKTRAFLEEHGGQDGILQNLTEMRGKAEELDGVYDALKSGNAAELLKEVAETWPEAIPQLGKQAVDRWAQVDPEGWQHAMSQVMAATISQSGVPMFLERMGMMLEFGKTEEVAKAIADLKQWTGSFAQAKAPERTASRQPDNKLSEREQAISQRENAIFTQDVQRDVDSFRSPLITQELKDFIANAPADAEKKQLAEEKVIAEVQKRMAADKDLQKKLDGFWQRRDRDGFLRLAKSREATLIKDIAPKVGRTIYGSPKAAAPAPVQRTLTPIRPAVPQRGVDPRDAVMQRILSR